MIGRNGEKGSGISVLTARHDDDDQLKRKLAHVVLKGISSKLKQAV